MANTWEVAEYLGGVRNVYAQVAMNTTTNVMMPINRCLRMIRNKSISVMPLSSVSVGSTTTWLVCGALLSAAAMFPLNDSLIDASASYCTASC